MKKQFTKKLALNKETVTNLGDSPMNGVKGGRSWPADCYTNDCPTSVGIICEYTCALSCGGSCMLTCAETCEGCPTYSGDPCCL